MKKTTSSPRYTVHLIGNAHLDPVWLWDWREGMTEGITTCRTILDLMDQEPDFTFIRGEAAIYEHIEKHDPQTFKRIVKQVKAGRWDVIGGTYIQPDTNLPDAETFARQYMRGQQYFKSRFGKPVEVAWAADSFGHSAGLPEVMAAAGIKGFCFTRPYPNDLTINKPAFWWVGPGGSRILCYRPFTWYGCERDEVPKRLDLNIAEADKNGVHNVGLFYGVGNHGGGPTRRMLKDIRKWAQAHPDIRVIHSGLHRLIESLSAESRERGADYFPSIQGELNFCLRGCYSSLARFKFPYRKTEAALKRAERMTTTISSGLGGLNDAKAHVKEAWDDILFNSFHDILPGTSIERAFEDQIAWTGRAYHLSQRAELEAMTQLSFSIDTRTTQPKGDHPCSVPVLIFNSLSQPFEGHLELEVPLDYRPVFAFREKTDQVPVQVLGPDKKPIPFQTLKPEHNFFLNDPWRRRVVAPVKIPALGWTVIEIGWVPNPKKVEVQTDVSITDTSIANARCSVSAQMGREGISVKFDGKDVFGSRGFGVSLFEDPWGSWGGLFEEKDSLVISGETEKWKVVDLKLVDSGTERANLWVKMAGHKSYIELNFIVYRGGNHVEVRSRVFLAERSVRLKLVMPVGDHAEYEVPGAVITRGPSGEVPGGKWVKATRAEIPFGFASDALYNFDSVDGVLRATVVRSTRYAKAEPTSADQDSWLPATDLGEHSFKFIMSGDLDLIEILAEQLAMPPVALNVPAKRGSLNKSGSFASLPNSAIKLLALKPAEDGKGFVLRIQNASDKACVPKFTFHGNPVVLSKVNPWIIQTWSLTKSVGQWKAKPVTLLE